MDFQFYSFRQIILLPKSKLSWSSHGPPGGPRRGVNPAEYTVWVAVNFSSVTTLACRSDMDREEVEQFCNGTERKLGRREVKTKLKYNVINMNVSTVMHKKRAIINASFLAIALSTIISRSFENIYNI
jgi:hypothetical protein